MIPSRFFFQDAFAGEEVIDTVSFGDITIPQQIIGASLISSGFDGVDGIIGYEYDFDSIDLS
jgi:hypothetical protein